MRTSILSSIASIGNIQNVNISEDEFDRFVGFGQLDTIYRLAMEGYVSGDHCFELSDMILGDFFIQYLFPIHEKIRAELSGRLDEKFSSVDESRKFISSTYEKFYNSEEIEIDFRVRKFIQGFFGWIKRIIVIPFLDSSRGNKLLPDFSLIWVKCDCMSNERSH